MATYQAKPLMNSLSLQERPIYGSDRLGMDQTSLELGGLGTLDLNGTVPTTGYAGQRRFELKDHLGNVCVTITGDRYGVDQTPQDGFVDYSVPKIVGWAGYEAFGSLLPGRNFSSSNYRWGFGSAEKDDEVHEATGTSYDFGARVYDPRVGRWWSTDPLVDQYPNISAYSYAANSPVQFTDEDGRVLRDARGNIIYSKSEIAPTTRTLTSGETIREQYVYIYSNDGSKHMAIIRTVTSGVVFGLNQSYDCHGLTKAEGRLFIDSGDPIEGILAGDGQGRSEEFSDPSRREVGDLVIFRGVHPGDGSSDRIIHSAIYEGEGVYRSKNGVTAEGKFPIETLEGYYGDDISYVHPVADKSLSTLSGRAGSSGLVEYSETEVRGALAADRRRETSRTKESWDAHKRIDRTSKGTAEP